MVHEDTSPNGASSTAEGIATEPQIKPEISNEADVDQPGYMPVTISEVAVEKLQRVMDEKGVADPILRVFVSGGGCSGLQYGMGFETNVEEGDQVFESGGMKIVVDPVSITYMEGAHVDYIDDLMGGGFKVDNPNAAKSCGCGQSFKPADGSARDAPEPPPGMSCGGCG